MENKNQHPQQQQQTQPQDFAGAPAPALPSDAVEHAALDTNENLEKLMMMQQQALEGHA